jgi:hypothetical protein
MTSEAPVVAPRPLLLLRGYLGKSFGLGPEEENER